MKVGDLVRARNPEHWKMPTGIVVKIDPPHLSPKSRRCRLLRAGILDWYIVSEWEVISESG